MVFKKRSTKKAEEAVTKTASDAASKDVKVDMAEEEIKSKDKIPVVPPKPVKKDEPPIGEVAYLHWLKQQKQ